jgi:hypothetical protein
MWALIITLLSFGIIIFLLTYLNRRNKTDESEIKIEYNDECCGAHEVCESESLLSSSDKIEYFDDEELDALAGMDRTNYSIEQENLIADVFFTLKESDVAAWLKSLQLRNINLPIDIREQALLIVSERREL